ncbi:hypothetical protein B0H19DRAFT_1231251 [Mycena capillaripes]|nr:hypothetical protein B0H19DRAFT_1231251 [Mycena capillaripes]
MALSSPKSVTAVASSSSVDESLMYDVLGVVGQTFFFGVYTLLISASTRMLLKRGLKIQTNRLMLFVTLFMYLISALYWTYSVIYAADRLQNLIRASPTTGHDTITKWLPLFNAVVPLNFVFGDGVVVWRAWVICQRRLRKYLWITMGFLALTAIAVFLIIGLRIAALIVSPINNLNKTSFLNPSIDILQVSTGVLSLFSNLSATAVVAATALRHRRILRDAFTDEGATTRSDQILALVVEVGAVYCLSTLILLVSVFIKLPHGTVGDLYAPVNVHIAGAYPPTVILLVSMSRSLSETTFLDSMPEGSVLAYPIRFASADVSPTTTVGGPDINHALEKSRSKPIHSSHFSESTFDARHVIV